jgi:hypothetical protein
LVHESFLKSKAHIEKAVYKTPYNNVYNKMCSTKKNTLLWWEIYNECVQGYSNIILTYADPLLIIKLLSERGAMVESVFLNIYESRIPHEVYILIDEMLSDLKIDNFAYNVVQNTNFHYSSIYTEVTLANNNVSFPSEPTKDVLTDKIKNNDVQLLYYESGQYDNPIAWSLLLHEIFHVISEKEKLEMLEKELPSVTWISEILNDTYLMHYFGPAYCMSSAFYLSRFPYHEALSHPHYILRLYESLLYLGELEENQELPQPLLERLKETRTFVNTAFLQFKDSHLNKEVTPEMLLQIEEIYKCTKDKIQMQISAKTPTFKDLVIKSEAERKNTKDLKPSEFIEREIFSIKDVMEYYALGMPIAANPRILFNSFISKSFLDSDAQQKVLIFIRESLKKWHVKKAWLNTPS